MDKSLGDLMGTVDRLGIAEETIIIFMSDNGSPGNNPRNLPLRGQKISGYEGGNRVPLIVHWPKVTATGKRNATPVIIDDIFPTILEMTGQGRPQERRTKLASHFAEQHRPTKGTQGITLALPQLLPLTTL